MEFENIAEELENYTELRPVNLSDEQVEEFQRVYRVLTQDMSNFYNFLKQQEYYEEQNQRYVNAMEIIIKMMEDEIENEPESQSDLELLKNDLQAQVDKFYDTREQAKENIEETTRRYERAENFMAQFTSDITFVDEEEGTCRVGEKTKFLIEYLHSLGNIVEQEERSEEQQ